jgi:hypothetical protein
MPKSLSLDFNFFLMNNSFFSVILGLFSLLISCNSKTEQPSAEGQVNMKMVMEVHDEAMPQMGALAQLTAQIKSQRDLDSTDIDLAESMKDLQEAHTLMMDWMKGFGTQFTANEIMKGAPLNPEKQELLNQEYQKVLRVRESMQQSMARARAILGDSMAAESAVEDQSISKHERHEHE